MILLMLIIPYFALSLSGVRNVLIRKQVHPVLFGGYIFATFFLYGLELIIKNQEFDFYKNTLLIVTYIFTPLILQIINKSLEKRSLLLDCISILAIWIPYDMKILPDIKVFGIFLPLLMGMLNAIFIYLIINPWNLDNKGKGAVGYSFRLKIDDFKISIFVAFILIAVLVPLGIRMGFLIFSHLQLELVNILGMIFVIYFFVALPQELLFRGIIQNMISKHFRNANAAIFITSLIFGISHINNSTHGFKTPNFAFVVFSFIAGLGYGYVWKKTGKITAAAITHAVINIVWEIFFLF